MSSIAADSQALAATALMAQMNEQAMAFIAPSRSVELLARLLPRRQPEGLSEDQDTHRAQDSAGCALAPVKTALIEEEVDRLELTVVHRLARAGRSVLTDPSGQGRAAGEPFVCAAGIGKAA